ncbi:hypothetical protein DIPPA_05339 [Diplonema papillatum]|nr:hypothetical protein DIPPA_05339 [Diplonema papillatum]
MSAPDAAKVIKRLERRLQEILAANPEAADDAIYEELQEYVRGKLGLTCSLCEPASNPKSWAVGPPYLVVDCEQYRCTQLSSPPPSPLTPQRSHNSPFPRASGHPSYLASKYSHYPIPKDSIVVDLTFKERWRMLRTTREYDEILQRTPQRCISTFYVLMRRLSLIAEGVKKAFESSKMYLPPWRTVSSMTNLYWYRDPLLVQKAPSAAAPADEEPEDFPASAVLSPMHFPCKQSSPATKTPPQQAVSIAAP